MLAISTDPEGLRVLSLIVASLGGFATGMVFTVIQQSRIVLKVGDKVIPFPRKSILVGAWGAALAIAAVTILAVTNPSLVSLGLATAVISVFGVASWGVVQSGRNGR